MDATEKRKVETQLVKMGLAGLAENGAASPALIQQIAGVVNNWKSAPNRHGEWIDRHKFLRDLFSECDQAARAEMYAAITPHLSFPALPLSSYESMITERINGLVSKRAMRVEGQAPKPVEVGGRKYRAAQSGESAQAMATLHCQNCWRKKRFIADTPAGAMIAARKAGWQRVPIGRFSASPKETCPQCLKKMATEPQEYVA